MLNLPPRFGIWGMERVKVPTAKPNPGAQIQNVVDEALGHPQSVPGGTFNAPHAVYDSFLTARKIVTDPPTRSAFREALAFALGMDGTPRWRDVQAKAREERAQNLGPHVGHGETGHLESEMFGILGSD